MTESDIIQALAKHCRDRNFRFFAHVKDGSPYYRQQRILDGFAVKDRQFLNSVTEGYEIKVSRSDFLRDGKWEEYLPVCTSFYFVTPEGLVSPDELPPGIGLLYCSERGVITLVKKAKRRETDQARLFELFKYLVLNRTYSETEKVKAALKKIRRIERDAAKDKLTISRQSREYKELYLEHRALRRAIRTVHIPAYPDED